MEIVEQQISEQIEVSLIGPLRDLLGPHPEVDMVAQAAQHRATLLAAQLCGEDDRVAAQTVIDLINMFFPGQTPIPDRWWATPVGRQVARSVGHPSAEAVSQSAAAAMLGVSQQRVSTLLDKGALDRHPAGGVTTASVRKRLVARPGQDTTTAVPLDSPDRAAGSVR